MVAGAESHIYPYSRYSHSTLMDETVIAIEKVLGKWLERAIRLARIFFPLRAFVFIGRTRSYVRQQISQISFSFFLFVSYSPVISEENSTPARLISEPDTRCAYYERQNLFVHRFSLLAPLLLTAKRHLVVRPLPRPCVSRHLRHSRYHFQNVIR